MTLPTLTCLLLDAYEREINVRLESFWDSGWNLYIGGDEMNGYTAEHQCQTLNEVCELLHSILKKLP